jgi:FkbM family methyltransferase
VVGKDLALTRDIHIGTEAYGNRHASWTLAAGMLSRSSVVYSAGVGTDISFDCSLIQRYGVRVYAFDPTDASAEWLRTQVLPEEFSFRQEGLFGEDRLIAFHAPENPGHVSHSVVHGRDREATMKPVRRVVSVMSELGHRRIDVLKMDIEGSEYSVVDDILRCRLEIDQVLVEFHHRFPEIGVEATIRAVQKLREGGYAVFNVSANGEEVSFVSRQRLAMHVSH